MIRIFFGLSLVLFLLTAFLPSNQKSIPLIEDELTNLENKEDILVKLTTSVLERWHYKPVEIDDEFSKRAFDTYLKYLDGSKRFLLKEEVESLEKSRLLLDDQIREGKRDLYLEAKEVFEQAKKRAHGFCNEILEKPLNITDNEYVELEGEKRAYAKSEDELKEHWRKWLEHEVLERYYTRVRKQEKRAEKEEDFDPKPLDSLLFESQEKVKDVFDRWFKRMDQKDEMDHFSTYLNVITNVYDPHTNFYKPRDKESFDIGMAGKLEGIGARLSSDGEETKVVSIVPGSPSWKQGELEVKDVITEVAQGEEEPTDITGMPIDEVVDLIRGDKGTEVRLTVRKIDGTITVIPIIRDVVILEEGFAKSMMIEHDDVDFKVGYLKLPKFYADFQDRKGRSSSKDVKEELIKLKEEGAEALIFDLRFNSGGSLRDVVQMVGHFIEEGPVVQVSNRDGSVEVLKDRDHGEVVWDHPVVILVNKFSASASEIFAAAMQDYNRAIIVGSPNTYGKGTVQRFIDLDRTINGFEEYKPLGSVKYTMQKYYRIDGGSTQLNGVESDVILPDSWHFETTGERELDYAMPWTSIDPVEYNQEVYDVGRIKKKVIRNSADRTENKQEFVEILKDAKRIHEELEDTYRSIEKDAFFMQKKEDEKRSEEFDDLFKENEKILPSNLELDIEYIQVDSSRIDRNDDWKRSIQEDIYLEEAIFILQDMKDLY